MRFKNVWTNATVISATDVAENVRLIELQPEGGIQAYNAGAHLDVSVFINDLPQIRHYSIVGTYEANRPYRIAVKRLAASRGGSEYMWRLSSGQQLVISQPKNQFQLTFGYNQYVLIAGGIGITPIYGMALELAAMGADFRLLYAGSSRREMPFIEDLKKCIGDRLSIFASNEGGRINVEAEITALSEGTQLYVCAPMRMLDVARRVWHQQKRPLGDLRHETFAASGQFAPQPFEVHVPRLDVTLTVPENQTLLDALTDAGVAVMSDCLRGECGLCMVDIMECTGKIDHRDMFFSDEQKADNRKLCACVSRVVDGNVVIDTAYRGKLSKI
jgi:vanillate O-demethylase ferredoxin subunit